MLHERSRSLSQGTSSHHEKGPGRRLAHTLWQAIPDGCHRSQSSSLRLCRNGRRIMRAVRFISILMLMALAAISSTWMHAQRSFSEHNSTMASLQPIFVTPLVAPDPRLIQYARFSVSHEYNPEGAETVNYGNGRGGGVISGNRFEFDFIPPPYVQHNSTADDGFADTSALAKYRIASGNAEHGNFEIAAILSHCFATGSHKNGATTDSYGTTLTSRLCLPAPIRCHHLARRHAANRQNQQPGKIRCLECPGAGPRHLTYLVRDGEQRDLLLCWKP